MRSNSVLVHTLLLLSVALADNITMDSRQWAGAGWRDENSITKWVAARVSLPRLDDRVGTGYNIVVALGGLACGTFALKTGITVKKVSDRIRGHTEYEAWGKWYSEADSDATTAPSSFTLSQNDEIGLVLQTYSSSSGFVVIINFTTQKVWLRFAHGNAIDCKWQRDADWFITTLTDQDIPNFRSVTFAKIETKGHLVPDRHRLTGSFIGKEGENVTSVIPSGDFITIIYVPLPDET